MAGTIRNKPAEKLAKELADRRHVSVTQAIIDALSNEQERERKKIPLADRIEAFRQSHLSEGMRGRDLTKDERDGMWGQ